MVFWCIGPGSFGDEGRAGSVCWFCNPNSALFRDDDDERYEINVALRYVLFELFIVEDPFGTSLDVHLVSGVDERFGRVGSQC